MLALRKDCRAFGIISVCMFVGPKEPRVDTNKHKLSMDNTILATTTQCMPRLY
jgi:hypothetical protein